MTAQEGIEELKRYSPISLIKMERIKQNAQWGEQNHDDFNNGWLYCQKNLGRSVMRFANYYRIILEQ